MSSVTIMSVGVEAAALASGLGRLLALDPAEAAARNRRICELAAARRANQRAMDAAREESERLARRVIAARVRAAGAAAALKAAGLSADPALTAPTGRQTSPAVQSWCGAVDTAIESALARASSARAAAIARQVAQAVPGAVRGKLVAAADALAAQEGPPDKPATEDRLVRIIGALDAGATAAESAVVHRAAQAIEWTGGGAETGLLQVRLAVQRANDAAARRRDDAIVAAQLLDAIEPYRPSHGLAPDRLESARRRLAEVVAGAAVLDEALLDDVEALRAAVEAAASADAVTSAFTDVLRELGYEAEPSFSVGTAEAGLLTLTHPDHPDHLVRMRMDHKTGTVASRLYRGAGAGADADEEAETQWCDHLSQAIDRLGGSGFTITPIRVAHQDITTLPATEKGTTTQHRRIEGKG